MLLSMALLLSSSMLLLLTSSSPVSPPFAISTCRCSGTSGTKDKERESGIETTWLPFRHQHMQNREPRWREDTDQYHHASPSAHAESGAKWQRQCLRSTTITRRHSLHRLRPPLRPSLRSSLRSSLLAPCATPVGSMRTPTAGRWRDVDIWIPPAPCFVRGAIHHLRRVEKDEK
jgi:hypothetical protein